MTLEAFVRCEFCGKHHGVTVHVRFGAKPAAWFQVPHGTWLESDTGYQQTLARGSVPLPRVRCSGCLAPARELAG